MFRPAVCRPAIGLPALLAAPALIAAQQTPTVRPTATAVGIDFTHIVVDSVALAGVTTLSELLQARAPGLLVQSTGGLPGSGARLAARGQRTMFAADQPLLVVDGVRTVGGTRGSLLDSTFITSRYDDIPVEQVATVDVLPGAAAAAQYGPGASAGAIVVTTRRATPGTAERRLYAEGGAGAAAGERPAFFRGVGTFRDGTAAPGCDLANQTGRQCTLTAVETVRPLDAAPWRTAPRGRAGGRIAGGNDRARYALGLDAARLGGPLAGSDVARGALRASADLHPAPAWRVTLGATASTQATDAPLDGLASTVDLAVNARAPFIVVPTHADLALTTRRLDAAGTVTWATRPWLTTRAALTSSHAHQRERSLLDRSYDNGRGRLMTEGAADARNQVTVAEVGASGAYRVARAALTTTLTAQRVDDRQRHEQSLTASNISRDLGPLQSGSGSARWQRANVRGLVFGQRLSAGRFAAGGTVRLDRVGEDGAHATSGAADAAYRVWERAGRVLTLRGAYGSAVAQPPANLLLPLFSAPDNRFAFGNVFLTGISSQAPAAPRFERTREAEVGVDVTLGPALAAHVTGYAQRTRDVLVPGPAFPTTFGSAYASLGTASVHNTGVEATVTARLVERPRFGATLDLRGWVGRNRVANLTSLPSVWGDRNRPSQTVRDGAALGAYYGDPDAATVRDYDGDGRVTWLDASSKQQALWKLNGDQRRALGSPVPTRTLAADVRARAGAHLVVAALVEHQGGYLAAGDLPAARGAFDPSAPLDVQARAAAAATMPEARLEPAGFVRLREVSAGWRLGTPGARGHATTLTLAGRNLLTSTRYTGLDPEADGGLTPTPFAIPVARTLAVRVSTGW